MAKAEAQNSWFSTYFFLIRSKSYNVLDPEIRRMIEEISSLGHVISLHFDTSIYDDFETGLFEELKLFEKIFGVTPTVISLHRPNEFFLQGEQLNGIGIRHTYEKCYFEEIKYISDSGGSFRFGHPLKSDAYERGEPIQLLTHPLWWNTDGDSPEIKLEAFFEEVKAKFSQHMADNCIPWRRFLEKDK